MVNYDTHETHISRVLGQMVKKWTVVLPEGVRALHKFDQEHKNVLSGKPEDRAKILADIRLKNFKGTATGERIDLEALKTEFSLHNQERVTPKSPSKRKRSV